MQENEWHIDPYLRIFILIFKGEQSCICLYVNMNIVNVVDYYETNKIETCSCELMWEMTNPNEVMFRLQVSVWKRGHMTIELKLYICGFFCRVLETQSSILLLNNMISARLWLARIVDEAFTGYTLGIEILILVV